MGDQATHNNTTEVTIVLTRTRKVRERVNVECQVLRY